MGGVCGRGILHVQVRVVPVSESMGTQGCLKQICHISSKCHLTPTHGCARPHEQVSSGLQRPPREGEPVCDNQVFTPSCPMRVLLPRRADGCNGIEVKSDRQRSLQCVMYGEFAQGW